jgi:hypothetical protein
VVETLTEDTGTVASRSDRYAPRVAGFAFLFLIAVDLLSGAAGRRAGLVLTAVAAITTLVLATMLYATVVRQDRNLALLALVCRTVEAGLSAVAMLNTLALLSLSGSHPGGDALADLLGKLRPLSGNIGAIFFAAGSTVYCYLLLKSRAIPVPLSAIGVVGSLLVLVGVPVQTALERSTFAGPGALLWVPVAVFEIVGGGWLLVKGARRSGAAA